MVYSVLLGSWAEGGFSAHEEAWEAALVAAVVDVTGLGVRYEGDVGGGGEAVRGKSHSLG